MRIHSICHYFCIYFTIIINVLNYNNRIFQIFYGSYYGIFPRFIIPCRGCRSRICTPYIKSAPSRMRSESPRAVAPCFHARRSRSDVMP